MAQTHYDTLGISRASTAAHVRSAYRKLVLKHHPDRSKDPNAADKFMKIVAAYEVLIDPEKRRNYDLMLTLEAERQAKVRSRPAPSPPPKETVFQQRQTRLSLAADLTKLTRLFHKGAYVEAEKLAWAIIRQEPKEAIPYAVLGDIARTRGEMNHAANMYAHAVQMDPKNRLYEQRYEELLSSTVLANRARSQGSTAATGAVLAASALTIISCAYIAVSKEAALLPSVSPISTWTLGLVVMLFLSGVGVGVCLSLGKVLDRFSSMTTTALGRISPTVALGSIAVVSFWAAVVLYAILGLTQRTANYSTTRLIGAVSAVVLFSTIAASASANLHPGQVFMWGGNLTYLGSICGWMVADSFRH